ncbi:hypothetical protein V1264_010440 [Littorina saxatilis]|uniref:Uncharacterized protein n=2 Tax=Littorina saxatilis TaxID=31220 RepID=A0AAN9G0A4_9CAEN
MVVSCERPLSDSVDSSSIQEKTDMGNWFGTSLDEAIDDEVNHGYTQSGSEVVILYRPQASKPNFGFVKTETGYQAKMRAKTGNGRTLGHDSRIIPCDVYMRIRSVSQGNSGDSYKVSFNTGGHDLTEYFN